ncbi:heterokaryon incompatibility protein-domain-containing protein [Xylogone sp. PMI_703]|nr:heterokaryon incompatibility protein-domain-containing protein [Xylogone sp. PMI_703]
MRLLHTSTLGVIPFIEGNNSSAITSNANEYPALTIPKYAILSHTWEDGEVTLQEIQDDREVIKAKAGYQKVKASCELAKRDGFEYIWIDTCCIDKTNSTELFEAINSMFRWYKNSSICYVYLADAEPRDDLSIVGPMPFEGSIEYTFRWYSRGWTLQELIALRNVSFFSKNWKFLGTKVDHLVLLSSATGIDPYSLNGGDLSRISVARRMSWLASRQTTRLEDIAYCMLGIFGINMPLLYGEGERAFVRLQEEILKNSNDQSLFVWKEPDSMDFYREDYGESYSKSGLLASSPAHFEIARSIRDPIF